MAYYKAVVGIVRLNLIFRAARFGSDCDIGFDFFETFAG